MRHKYSQQDRKNHELLKEETKKHKKHIPENLPVRRKKVRAFRGILGPGLVTGASDDDPSGIATYSQAGAMYGLQTLWTAMLTLPLMAAIQEMCGRIGIVTKQGIMGVLRSHYSKHITFLIALLTIPACILNIGADFAGMGAVSQMIIPAIHEDIWIFIYAILIVVCVVFFPFKKFESVMKWLAISLGVYFIIPFLVSQDRLYILSNVFIPHIQRNKEFIAIIVAILGTTISPYLFVWQASMEVEETEVQHEEKVKHHHRLPTLKNKVHLMRKGNATGMIFSNVATFFIMLTAGTILFNGGIHTITTVQDAANALKPLAGDRSYALFALGVLGTGFLTIPVLAGACSYIISEVGGWKGSINHTRSKGRSFYLVIIVSVLLGAVMNLLHIDPIKSLIWSAIGYGLIAPVLIAIIIHICNNKKVMGEYTNGRIANTLGIICLLFMGIAAIAMIYTSIF